MWRCPKAQSFKEESKTAFCFFGVDLQKIKDHLLNFRIMNSHAAAGGFVAVDHQIVAVRTDLAWVCFQIFAVLRIWLTERMMFGIEAAFVRIPCDQREVDHPQATDVAGSYRFCSLAIRLRNAASAAQVTL